MENNALEAAAHMNPNTERRSGNFSGGLWPIALAILFLAPARNLNRSVECLVPPQIGNYCLRDREYEHSSSGMFAVFASPAASILSTVTSHAVARLKRLSDRQQVVPETPRGDRTSTPSHV